MRDATPDGTCVAMTPSVDLHEGRELSGRIRIVRRLAQGGMADLWIAEHRTLGIEVVVKVLTPRGSRGPTACRRFMREARVTAKVICPHVVRVFDCDDGTASADGEPFLVMELLQGEDLSARIARTGRLSIRETVTIVEHVSLALQATHGLGIVHRDVKPENVFVVEGPEGMLAKLVDFGVAKDAAEEVLELTRADAMMGTPAYMSPEQVVSARDVDSRCDVWSLAVLAYSCLTGKTPFDGPTFGALCVAIHGGKFECASRTRPELPASVDAFFEKAFRSAIALRYQSARELQEAFRQATWDDASVDVMDYAPRTTLVPPGEDAMSAASTLLVLDDLDETLPRGLDTGDNDPIDLARPRSGVRPKRGSAPLRGSGERGRG
jgi:serine/threonine protein kinase